MLRWPEMNFTRRCRVLPPPDKWREHEIHSDCSASCHAFFVPRVILVIYLYTIHFHFEQSLAHRQPLFLWTGQQNNKSAELYFRYLLGCALRWWCKTLGLVHGSAGWDLGLGSVRSSNQGPGTLIRGVKISIFRSNFHNDNQTSVICLHFNKELHQILCSVNFASVLILTEFLPRADMEGLGLNSDSRYWF